MTTNLIRRANSEQGSIKMSGAVLVVAIVAIVAVVAIILSILKPEPLSSVEIARQKQLRVYGDENYFNENELRLMTSQQIDEHINMLNYMIRINDSLKMLSTMEIADPESEYSLAEANHKLVITGLTQRRTAATARSMKIAGRISSPYVDSLFDVVHHPMPPFPDSSEAIRKRNLEFERYESAVFKN